MSETELLGKLIALVEGLNELVNEAALRGILVELSGMDVTSSEHKARATMMTMTVTQVLYEG